MFDVCNKLILSVTIQFLRFCSLFDQRAMRSTFCQGHRSPFKSSILFNFTQYDPAYRRVAYSHAIKISEELCQLSN